MPTANRDGTSIAYEVDGPADGEPVVFVEGLGYGRWMWRWQRRGLSEEYRTILPDNRGTGESDAPSGPYTIEGMAADLEAVLADVGVEEAHVVGASMGGMIAQTYALEYDRAATISLLCTSPGGPEAEPVPERTQQRLLDVPEGADERETIRYRMEPAVSDGFYDENPDLVDRIVDWRLESDADEEPRAAQAAAVEAFDESDRVSDLEVPALVLHGTEDRVVPVENAELLAERLPDASLALCEGGPHLFFIEESAWVNERLREFLSRHPLEEGRA
ncbi:3-oxoadipate enol-lactone hydrolase [Halobiforma lacisalsi AJ5]|uniref:3-oxoadipate enol-lactone hydrolase n=1 Tax=Natronobacterium lacisalsi AJ5 TaxID=358396 RepID=M0LGW1_NATLA|nr:alpha/beta hydrolase [Halobiforma lacisalsi]APW99110.1 3-oxoadipate enol-lactone hydrolase [Halobiforma lacisalsi AJ5]EMA31230.1 3-oxoadipate enol-lactone hydrolase [Halobiforma lacisalsi AJ5]